MDSDKAKEVNQAIEAKLSEILPDLVQLLKEAGASENFKIELEIDPTVTEEEFASRAATFSGGYCVAYGRTAICCKR
jgi:hypothetical protein